MIEVPADRAAQHRLFQAIDRAFRIGDAAALARLLGPSPRWFDEEMPAEFGLGHPLEYAIYWSPLAFVGTLVDLGANVDYDDAGGFPALIATLSTDRPDRAAVLRLLLERGAAPGKRGINDWTPLHYAVARRDRDAVALLLAFGADPHERTRIDDLSTPLEDARAAGFAEAAALLEAAAGGKRPPRPTG